MGDCGHNRHGLKRGGMLGPFCGRWGELGPRLTQCGLGWGLLLCQVGSSSIQLFGHNRHKPKTGGRAPFRGELGPHLTQHRLGRGLPSYQVASWSIQPFGHNRHGLKIGGALPPFWGGGAGSPSTQCCSDWGLPHYLIGMLFHPSTWPQQTWAEN